MSDNVPNAIYYVMIIVFVASALISMRLPVGRAVRMAAAWVAIFGVAFILFAFRGEFTGLFDRLRAEATGAAIVSGGEVVHLAGGAGVDPCGEEIELGHGLRERGDAAAVESGVAGGLGDEVGHGVHSME